MKRVVLIDQRDQNVYIKKRSQLNPFLLSDLVYKFVCNYVARRGENRYAVSNNELTFGSLIPIAESGSCETRKDLTSRAMLCPGQLFCGDQNIFVYVQSGSHTSDAISSPHQMSIFVPLPALHLCGIILQTHHELL